MCSFGFFISTNIYFFIFFISADNMVQNKLTRSDKFKHFCLSRCQYNFKFNDIHQSKINTMPGIFAFEPTHEKRDRSVMRFLFLQTCMCSYPVEPELQLCLKLPLVP